MVVNIKQIDINKTRQADISEVVRRAVSRKGYQLCNCDIDKNEVEVMRESSGAVRRYRVPTYFRSALMDLRTANDRSGLKNYTGAAIRLRRIR